MKKNILFILLAFFLCLSACSTDTQNESSKEIVPTSTAITDTTSSLDLISQTESLETPQKETQIQSEEKTYQLETLQEETQTRPEEDNTFFKPTSQNKDFLTHMCFILEDFGSHADMDETFWKNFIFHSYTAASSECIEHTVIYREDLGFDEYVVKVSLEEVEAYTKLLFGIDLPDIKPAFEDMMEEQASYYYQDNYYYIGVSDFPDYEFIFHDCTVYEEEANTYAIVTYMINYGNLDSKLGDVGTITFILYPADNENGFIISSKTTKFFE